MRIVFAILDCFFFPLLRFAHFFFLRLRRGLCQVLRTEAGNADDDDDDEPEYRNNAHWLPRSSCPGPSSKVAYYDAASLYPSSGEPAAPLGRVDASGPSPGAPGRRRRRSPGAPASRRRRRRGRSPLPSASRVRGGAKPPARSSDRRTERADPSPELTDLPVGTGLLYVRKPLPPPSTTKAGKRRRRTFAVDASGTAVSGDEDDDPEDAEGEEEPEAGSRRWRPPPARALVRERTALNPTETEEAAVVQYLVLGGGNGEAGFTGVAGRVPDLVASGVHAGAGRQTFGWSPQQKADLLLVYLPPVDGDGPSRVFYHNHHGSPWHYSGHAAGCPLGRDARDSKIERTASRLADSFRRGLATALTAVDPGRVVFRYTVTDSCRLAHGSGVPGLNGDGARYRTVRECLLTEKVRNGEAWVPDTRRNLYPLDQLRADIAAGRATGFVTLVGGSEHPDVARDDPAGHRFGFCVQQHAATFDQLSDYTKAEIASYFGWAELPDGGESRIRDYVARQPARNLSASTFFSQETVSTTYLRWLVEERGFRDYEITHFLAYPFRDWGSDFLLPVLQRRHECKLRGDAVAAECLKLVGNGSYGYNGLEARNYDDLRLMTDQQIRKAAGTGLGHLSFKHLTLLGLVKAKTVTKAPSRTTKRRKPPRVDQFFSQEALEGSADDEDDDDDEEEEEEEEEVPVAAAAAAPPQDPAEVSDEEEEDDDEDDDAADYRAHASRLSRAVMAACNWNLGPKKQPRPRADDSEDQDGEGDDLEEVLVRRAEHDHGYARKGATDKKAKARTVYKFLYAVSTGGDQKAVFNTLPRAAAVLSNSKRLFLGHLSTFFRCLDPAKAELCYVDTDSCVWSLSSPDLSRCLRSDRLRLWAQRNVIADEEGPVSCHGKMKLEGLYDAGRFRNLKIYRLYNRGDADEDEELSAAYTRCKGVNRKIGARLPDHSFDPRSVDRTVVHQGALRPTAAGEIHLVHESRTLAVPFNFKRRVSADGYHTLCFV